MCDGCHYKTLIACYFLGGFPPFCSPEWYAVMQSSWWFFRKPLQWHTTHQRMTSTFISLLFLETWCFFFFPLQSLITLHGVVFTEAGCQIFSSLMLSLKANTHSYTLFTYVMNVFMFHEKSNCFSRGDKKMLFLPSSNSRHPGGPPVTGCHRFWYPQTGESFELISSISCFSWGFSLWVGEKEEDGTSQPRERPGHVWEERDLPAGGVEAECCARVQAFLPDPSKDPSKGSFLSIPAPNISFWSAQMNPFHTLQHTAFCGPLLWCPFCEEV